MNKTAIKNYAIWARVQLIEAAKQRAFEYEITDGGENKPGLDTIGGRLLSKTEKEQRKQLIDEIDRKGFAQVMEEAAYTWFNRFIALRFMEVNGYLPSKVRVFTDENGAFKPEILKQAMTVELEGLDRKVVLDLLDKQNNEELYKYLLITQCNALNAGLPYMFEKIANWTELLFPANLLRQDSVVGKLISDVAVEDWSDEVEIIGWFYQYYISEKHEEVVDPLHGKVVNKEDIPAATQLFTTDWVVRYILDNSLGRYWIERHTESKLAEKLTYFVMPKDGILLTVNENILPEELKVLDPCVGSGHFLSYAFDILMEIYRECGWSDRDAAKSILENNLYGIDIDDRAAQLACFAVMMKARKYNRRIISDDTKLHILSMQDSTAVTDDLIQFVAKRDASIQKDLNELRLLFNNAKEYGSIISVPKINFGSLYARMGEIQNAYADNMIETLLQSDAVERLLPLIRQAEILAGKYDVVATNPPYMNKYSARLKAFIGEHFDAYKGDLFSVFMYRNFAFCKPNGYSGFMTPMVWMFIKTYEELRKYIIGQKSIMTLIQFEYSAFEEATVPICSFVLRNGKETVNGLYFKLSNFRGGMEVQRVKVEEAIQNKNCGYFFEADESNFSKIPGSPVAYWVSNRFIDNFTKGKSVDSFGSFTGSQNITGDNERFLRYHWEINKKDIGNRWFFYAKGGDYRQYFGNLDLVIDWSSTAQHFYDNNKTSNLLDKRYWFKEGITYSAITSRGTGFRYLPTGCLFDKGGPSINVTDHLYEILALFNSNVAKYYFLVFNPSINLQVKDVKNFPIIFGTSDKVSQMAQTNTEICEQDWNSFETSSEFKTHPLV